MAGNLPRWLFGQVSGAGGRSNRKLLYLVLNDAAAEWKRPPRKWAEAKTQYAIMFNERFVNS